MLFFCFSCYDLPAMVGCNPELRVKLTLSSPELSFPWGVSSQKWEKKLRYLSSIKQQSGIIRTLIIIVYDGCSSVLP